MELIEDVVDWRKLLNPEDSADFPVGTAMCRRLLGCCTKSVVPGCERYMAETSPLHWRIRRTARGHVYMQTKHTVDSELWSEPVFHWDTTAVRPHGRDCEEHESGLKPTDLTLAPRTKLPKEREDELFKSLEGAKPRLTPEEMRQAMEVFEELTNPTPVNELPHPTHQWTFQCEQKEPDAIAIASTFYLP